MKRVSTLCFECKNYRCSWLEWGKPVDGWTAIGHKEIGQKKPYYGENPKSYTVLSCPEKK